MRATSVWMRAALVLTATGGAISAAGCNELTGADQFVESACYPLPPSQCGAGDGGADAMTAEAGGDSAMVDSTAAATEAGDGASDSGAVVADAEGGMPSEGGDAACPPGDLSCGGVCVPNDAHHCGTCTHDCTALPNVSGQVTCGAGGVCQYGAGSCASGYAHCGDGGPDQGCETQINASPNCGACGVSCGAGTPDCSGSGGTYACVSGCGGGETLCGSTCTDTMGDRNNCGACGTQCGTQVQHATPTCSGSMCGYTCNNGYSKCNGRCVDYSSDPANCGSCGNGCTGGKTCSGGTCACPAGTLDCAGTCEMPAPQNGCGAGGTCDSACSGPTAGMGAASCNGASCSLSCTGSTPDQCGTACVDTSSDGKNCGTCGHDCLGGVCTGGICQPVTLATSGGFYLTIDQNNVYWIGGPFNPMDPNLVSVESCPKTGGCGSGTPLYQPASVSLGGLATPASSSSSFGGNLYTVEASCAPPSTFEAIGKNPGSGIVGQTSVNLYPAPSAMAFDSANSWVYMLYGTALERIQPGGTQLSTFLGGLNANANRSQISIDSQNVYVPDWANNRVLYCPLSGTSCSIGTVMTGVSYPQAVYSDGTYVWVAAAGTAATTGTISRCKVNMNCANSPDPIATGQGNPTGIVADGTYAYWTNYGSGQIMRCAIAGCGGMPTVLAKSVQANSIVADASAIYWAEGGRIAKLAK